MEDLSKKRSRDDSFELDSDSVEVKRLREDLLDFLDDSDPDPATQDLDFFMKSFEEEISAAKTSSHVPVVDLTSESGDSQAELGYLQEASDDELGLPPSLSVELKDQETESVRILSDSSAIGDLWGFEDQIPSYDSFEFGSGDNYNSNTEYLALDGLFEYSDACFDSSDFSWRQETMP